MSMNRLFLHLDVNSYFASVEQQANPFLRGRPVAVVAQLKSFGAIIASSKEAKKLGIKVGLRASDALAIDPHCAIVEVDPPKYRSTTERLFAILAEYSEEIEPYSIDEAFVEFTGHVKTIAEVEQIARTLQQRMHDEVGEWLTCSIGIAHTRWLAKFAGDTAPKGKILVLTQEKIDAHIAHLKLTDAWGIADRMQARLNALGIFTLMQLKYASPERLKRSLGLRGYELWADLNGLETAGLIEERLPKSVGHQHMLRRRTNDHRFHRSVLMKLCERTGRRLRSLGLEAYRVGVHASIQDDHGVGGDRSSTYPFRSSYQLFQAAWNILKPQVNGRRLTFLSVWTLDLRPVSRQTELFPPPLDEGALSNALDKITNRFGEDTVIWGAMWGSREHAPDRVGFRKTVSWDLPFNQIIRG